jgi:hypothetical protein
MTLLDICAYLGLGAVGATSVNLLIGLLMALRYSPVRHWPHRRIMSSRCISGLPTPPSPSR